LGHPTNNYYLGGGIMITSTSVNAKLYSYLEGFETVCFTGLPCKQVTNSIRQLITDEIRLNFPDQSIQQERLNHVLSNIDKFFIRYYDRMRNIKTSDKVKSLADKSKEDKNTLDSILSHLMSTDNCSLTFAAYMAISRTGEPMDICEKCPWYCNHKFCMIYGTEQSEDAEIQNVSFWIAEYKYLAAALLQMANLLVTDFGVSIANLDNYYTVFTNILTCSHIYELMNPSGDAREEYLADALAMLQAPHINYDTDEYHRYDDLLSEVFKDVIIGKLPYAQEMHKALFACKNFLSSPFDEDKDFYYSMKGTGQSAYTGERHSLQSSAFEVDVHKNDPRVQEFDKFISYNSRYKEDLENPPTVFIKTIGINNPGKFKPRIIHIADNPLQDRCNWIHRRLMAMCEKIPSDCTKNQDKGRLFLQNLTRQWYLQYPEKIGIYCTDFSNATDTVDQRFTHRILEFVFNSPEVANFWDYVSQLDKEFCHADGRKEVYHQSIGQPQGLLASFLIFALCHHFLFLMDMKEFGMTDIKASEFYTVLGDDAVYNTVYPEKRFVDEDITFTDECGIVRSELEIAHFNKCQAYAGFKINYDKSESAHSWSDEAKLDFAKVTYRNGKLFSPVPFRLAMRYGQSFDDKLAVSIWRADRDDKLANQLVEIQLETLPSDKVESYRELIRCGELPFLDKFYDRQERPEQYLTRVRYALFVSLLNAGLSFTILNDNHRSNLSYDIYDKAMATIFTSSQRIRLDKIDPNHKVMLLLYKNSEIIQTLHEIYGQTEFDDQFLTMCLASFLGDQSEEILWMIYDIASFQRILRMAAANPNVNRQDLEDNFPAMRPYRDVKKDVNIISNAFITRGITKRPGESSYLFRKVLLLMDSLHQQLDKSFDESTTVSS
jgi:hypothetical protein